MARIFGTLFLAALSFSLGFYIGLKYTDPAYLPQYSFLFGVVLTLLFALWMFSLIKKKKQQPKIK